jgi:hypothetical protein
MDAEYLKSVAKQIMKKIDVLLSDIGRNVPSPNMPVNVPRPRGGYKQLRRKVVTISLENLIDLNKNLKNLRKSVTQLESCRKEDLGEVYALIGIIGRNMPNSRSAIRRLGSKGPTVELSLDQARDIQSAIVSIRSELELS